MRLHGATLSQSDTNLSHIYQLIENKIQTRINTTLIYQVFFDSHSKFVTVKVSDLALHEKEMQRRGIDTEQFIKRVIKFYLNSDVPDGDGTVIYK